MMASRPALDTIKYLAFEGGGGKGMAYLGAVTALEELIPAPLPEPPQVEETPIGADAVVNIEAQAPLIFISKPIASRFLYGVSGASVGAITAFYIAMGMSARSIDRELNESARELLRLEAISKIVEVS